MPASRLTTDSEQKASASKTILCLFLLESSCAIQFDILLHQCCMIKRGRGGGSSGDDDDDDDDDMINACLIIWQLISKQC